MRFINVRLVSVQNPYITAVLSAFGELTTIATCSLRVKRSPDEAGVLPSLLSVVVSKRSLKVEGEGSKRWAALCFRRLKLQLSLFFQPWSSVGMMHTQRTGRWGSYALDEAPSSLFSNLISGLS